MSPAPGPRIDGREAVLAHLLENGCVDELSISRARSVAKRTRQPVDQTLNQMGVVSDEELVLAYSAVSGLKVWDALLQPPSPDIATLAVAPHFLRQRRLLPLARSESKLLAATCDPFDREALDGLAFAAGMPIEVVVAHPADWRKGFSETHGEAAQASSVDERKVELDVQLVTDAGADSESARLLSMVFETALLRGASDIHFEPRRLDLRVRLRVDGRLTDFHVVSADLSGPVVSRVKVLANLDLGERRLPQDGRATFVVQGRPIDVRVSTVPSAFGESAVLRLLDRAAVGFDFSSLGFGPAETALLDRVAHSPHGIFLVTGPTGSGKTTTLYALLNSLAHTEKKILSIEDPIEYHFQHVVQTQAAPAIGLTFASALRSFLRQDPDVILVGEIRDAETAQVAIQAAMTGHLVLASLHANDALKVVPRLMDMGVEPYQLAAALLGSLAQRLVRRLCQSCRQPRGLTAAEQVFLRDARFQLPGHVFEASGCGSCGDTGWHGRIALVEGLFCNEEMSAAIAARQPMTALNDLGRRHGMRSMLLDGCDKAAAGLTSVLEVMATVGE